MVQAPAQEIWKFTRSNLNISIGLSERGVTLVELEVMRRMGRVFGLGRPAVTLSRCAVGRFLCRAVGQEQLTNAQRGNFAASSFSGSSAIPSASSKRA